VRPDLIRAGRTLLLPTLALAFVLAFVPGEAGLAARIYALFVCVLAFLVALAALRRALPPAQPLRPRSGRRSDRRRTAPETLERIEQETLLGVTSSFDLHHRLRPRLRDIASELLSARRRVSLDEDPEAARTILGDRTWELVRPERAPPEDRFAQGIPPGELAGVVESLERI
jgi:hypothetical protein